MGRECSWRSGDAWAGGAVRRSHRGQAWDGTGMGQARTPGMGSWWAPGTGASARGHACGHGTGTRGPLRTARNLLTREISREKDRARTPAGARDRHRGGHGTGMEAHTCEISRAGRWALPPADRRDRHAKQVGTGTRARHTSTGLSARGLCRSMGQARELRWDRHASPAPGTRPASARQPRSRHQGPIRSHNQSPAPCQGRPPHRPSAACGARRPVPAGW